MKERDHISKFLRVCLSKTLEKALEKTQRMLEAAEKHEVNAGFREWKNKLSAWTNSEQGKTLSTVFGSRKPRVAPPVSKVNEYFESVMGKRTLKGTAKVAKRALLR